MKVKLRTKYAGPKGCFAIGTVYETDEDEGNDLIKGGYAVPVSEIKKAETSKEAPTDPTKRIDAIADVIMDISQDKQAVYIDSKGDSKALYMADGRPQVVALEHILGWNISATERNKAQDKVDELAQ